MGRKLILCILFLVAVGLTTNSIYAQESSVDYKQLVAKCSEAIKQAKSYCAKMEYKNSFTINSQENKGNSAELHIVFISPDRFKIEQVIDEGKDENLWDGWILIGNDYYVLNAAFGWEKGDDENRISMCKAYSPEGIIRQLEGIEKTYKRDSIRLVTKDGIECFVIKYLFGKESVDMKSLPPEFIDSKVSGTYEIWINKNNYLPLKQSEEASYYLNEQNKATSSTNLSYSSYGENKIKIDKPALGSKTF